MTADSQPVRRWQADAIALSVALADAAALLGPLTVLASTPSAYVIASDTAGDDLAARAAGAYELRAFSPAGELTWTLPYGRETGRAQLLLAAPDGEPAGLAGWEQAPPLAVIDRLPHAHVLWGSVLRVEDGRAIVGESRVGEIAVPVAARIGDPVALLSEELVTAGVDGNAMIAAERLIAFETVEVRR